MSISKEAKESAEDIITITRDALRKCDERIAVLVEEWNVEHKLHCEAKELAESYRARRDVLLTHCEDQDKKAAEVARDHASALVAVEKQRDIFQNYSTVMKACWNEACHDIDRLQKELQAAVNRDDYRENLVRELKSERDTLRERVKERDAEVAKLMKEVSFLEESRQRLIQ